MDEQKIETAPDNDSDETKTVPMEAPNAVPAFTFRRMSGLDQAILTTDAEWQNLDKLDPQIWMALSCPIKGLEFDLETLKILDADDDGRIRAQDVKDAVAWVCQRVVHPSKFCESQSSVDIENLRDDTDEGRVCRHALELILKKNDPSATSVTREQIDEVLAEATDYVFNGDGVIIPDSAPDDPTNESLASNPRAWTLRALAIVGGKKDASGKPGLDAELIDEARNRLKTALEWRKSLQASKLPLGEKTEEAWALYNRLAPKLIDYFSRCNLASFDPDALARLNAEGLPINPEVAPANPANELLNNETLLKLPISRINADCVLDIKSGLNPAWADDVKTFLDLVAPLVPGSPIAKKLDQAAWKTISESFNKYAEILEKKPDFSAPPAGAEIVSFPGDPDLALAPADDPLKRAFLPLNPNEAIGSLDDAKIEEMLGAQAKSELDDLLEKDLAAPPLSSFQELRKLVLFRANLYTFLMNFLSFVDFYEPTKKAIFQEGVLYLDSRACYLCVPVENVDDHARLAAQSCLCLIYCACSRKATDGSEQTGTIAAALTLGNLASLIEGRHGLFIDNDGLEWDTSILRVVHNPISLREAAWAPYIRISNMAAEQINKFVSSKEKAVSEATEKAVTNLPAAPKPEEKKQSFDFAKGAGIFAAVSVAISVLSAAFAYIANSLASLGWWWPLALVCVFICISGPSMLLAYFKLRKRSLGPLLDASGWAVNKGAPINIMMGMALTKIGHLPKNAIRNLNDPYSLPERMKGGHTGWKIFFWLLFILILAIACFWLYCHFISEPVWIAKARTFLGW